MKDTDYATSAVGQKSRRSNLTMFMIMLGFTFFSASMWVGQQLAEGMDFYGFLKAILLGGIVLGAYTGALGYIGAKTGLSYDLLSQRTFGKRGSWLPEAVVSLTQIGWFGVGLAMFAIPVAQLISPDNTVVEYLLVALAGVCMSLSAYHGIKGLTWVSYVAVPAVAILGTVAVVMAMRQGNTGLIEQFAQHTQGMSVITGMGLVIGSFVSGGTSTPNFTRFAKDGKSAAWITVVAFFLGNSLMLVFGAVAYAYAGGNDIFQVMINLGLFYAAILVLGLNIWTTNDNAIYTASLALANIFGTSKKTMVLISGAVGTVAAVWLYYNFCSFLNILNCALPPIGIIIILDYFCSKEQRQSVNWFSVAGVITGAVVANILPFGIASINGMIAASACYFLGNIKKH